jgi:hypothetical protein
MPIYGNIRSIVTTVDVPVRVDAPGTIDFFPEAVTDSSGRWFVQYCRAQVQETSLDEMDVQWHDDPALGLRLIFGNTVGPPAQWIYNSEDLDGSDVLIGAPGNDVRLEIIAAPSGPPSGRVYTVELRLGWRTDSAAVAALDVGFVRESLRSDITVSNADTGAPIIGAQPAPDVPINLSIRTVA